MTEVNNIHDNEGGTSEEKSGRQNNLKDTTKVKGREEKEGKEGKEKKERRMSDKQHKKIFEIKQGRHGDTVQDLQVQNGQ